MTSARAKGPKQSVISGLVTLGSNRPALTGLRAFAVILVFLHHMDVLFLPDVSKWTGSIFRGAFVGVDLFFVLSGFLITTILCERYDESGRVDFRQFLRDRIYRLVPALLAVVTVTGLVMAVSQRATVLQSAYSIAAALTYTSNWVLAGGGFILPALAPTWSLSVEAQFYLVWPLVIAYFARRKLTPLSAGCILLAGVASIGVWRYSLWSSLGDPWAVFPRTDVRADSLLMGALASVVWRGRLVRGTHLRLLAIPALSVLIWFAVSVDLRDDALYSWGYVVAAAASAILVLALLETDWWLGRIFSLKSVVYLGDMSYSLYLWHMPVMFLFVLLMPGSPVVQIGLSSILAFTLAALSRTYIERPALRLKVRRSLRENALPPLHSAI